MADVIDIKVTCAECDDDLEFEIKNGVTGFALVKITVKPCHSCQDDLKANLQEESEDEEKDLESLKEKIRNLINE